MNEMSLGAGLGYGCLGPGSRFRPELSPSPPSPHFPFEFSSCTGPFWEIKPDRVSVLPPLSPSLLFYFLIHLTHWLVSGWQTCPCVVMGLWVGELEGEGGIPYSSNHTTIIICHHCHHYCPAFLEGVEEDLMGGFALSFGSLSWLCSIMSCCGSRWYVFCSGGYILGVNDCMQHV